MEDKYLDLSVFEWHRFALLHHTGWKEKGNHYDLVLETIYGEDQEEQSLLELTSRSRIEGEKFNVELMGPIRRRYLFYEGSMTRRRGEVKRIDKGAYIKLWTNDIINPSGIIFRGKTLKGAYKYTRTKNGFYIFEQCGVEGKDAIHLLPNPEFNWSSKSSGL